MGYTLIITSGRAGDDDSRRGGVLILLDDSSIDLVKTLHLEPGFIQITISHGGNYYDVANIYAPVTASKRIDFYQNIRQKITKDTIIGGDWNTVPDRTVDIHSRNPLAYPNIGASLLATIMEEKGLIDERREQLGEESEYTRKGDVVGGLITSTRLDRWYLPANRDWLLTFKVDNSIPHKPKASDHNAVWVKIDTRTGELGAERVTLDAQLMNETYIQDKIAEIVSDIYQPNNKKSEAKKWSKMNGAIYDYLLKETQARKKKTKTEIKDKLALLRVLGARHKKLGATPRSSAHESRLQNEIYELKHPEVKDPPRDKQAKYMYDKSEVCTRAMFSTYKDKMKQQWINKVKINDWREDTPPNFNGTTTSTGQVGDEFVKLYKVIFSEKQIDML